MTVMLAGIAIAALQRKSPAMKPNPPSGVAHPLSRPPPARAIVLFAAACLWPATAPPAAAAPDLIPISLTAPAVLAAGTGAAATWTVSNAGATAAPPTWRDWLFLSVNPDLEPYSDRSLGEALWTEALPPGTTNASELQFTVPHVPPGLYFLILAVDYDADVSETSEANNTLSWPVEIRVPDLEPVFLEAPPAGDAGQGLEVTWAVRNSGNATAQPVWRDRLYLSTDPLLDPNDHTLGTIPWTEALPPGTSYQTNLPCAVPNVPPGTYYLLVQADRYNNLYEAAETNNTRARPIAVRVPDLAPLQATAPATVRPQQSFQLDWPVTNLGLAEARPAWWDHLFLSTNATLELSDSLLLSVKHADSLAGLVSYTNHFDLTVPGDQPLGDYYLLLRADYHDTVYEITETNNVRAQPIRVIPPEPVQLLFATRRAGNPGPPQVNLQAPGVTLDRAEFTLNDLLLGTAYGPPFTVDAGRMSASAQLEFALAGGRVSAFGFDTAGAMVCQTTSGLGQATDGFPTELTIEHPGRDYTIMTDSPTSPSHDLLIRVYAAFERFSVREGATSEETGTWDWFPLAEGQFAVRFLVDDTLVYTSTNGLPADPFYHEYTFNTLGLADGTHRITVNLVHPDNYRHASDSRVFYVRTYVPSLTVGREVQQHSNHFTVTLTVHNGTRGSVVLRRLRENMVGFQACRVDTSLPLDAATTTFSLAEQTCALECDFGANTVLAGDSRALTYRAVPVLLQTDCEYAFRGDGFVEYADASGTVTNQHLVTTTFTSPEASRRSIVDAAKDAFRASDYLLVTSPANLERAHSPSGAVAVLTDMADLASRRNGVLGYFHGSGMIRSPFRPGDLLALGDVFRKNHARDELYVGSVGNDRIYARSETSELNLDPPCGLPLCVDLRPGDQLAAGNVRTTYESIPDFHSREEIVVAWGDEHAGTDAGKVLVYQYDYATNGLFTVHELSRWFATGDKLAVGQVWEEANDEREEVIVAGTDGTIVAHGSLGAWALAEFVSFDAGDYFAAGNLMDDSPVELVIGNLGGGLRIYRRNDWDRTWGWPLYAQSHEVAPRETLEADDGLAVGDVLGDEYAEIVVAFASRDQIRIYGYDAAASSFAEVGRFDVTFDASDQLAVGYFGSLNKAQIVIAHGAEVTHRQAGTIEVYPYVEGLEPGTGHALDRLIERNGAWARRLATHWADEGYLLVVGETEIIPTFSITWDDIWWGDDGRVDYTDRKYASTDSSTENSVPELSVGRIVGNSAERLCQALRTAIEVAGAPWRLNNSDAYCVSGHDEDDDDYTVGIRQSIAGKLSARGFSVVEHHEPGTNDFALTAKGEDVIFFTPHGNPHGTSGVNAEHIAAYFDPRQARPLVFACSCSTGRYPAGTGTFSEEFLLKRAAAYIGATELTYHWGSHGRGWSPRFAEGFFDRLEAGRPIGRTLTLAKQYRLSGSANTRGSDWDRNRYHCAVYHLYGDPKLEVQWASGVQAHSPALMQPAGEEPAPLHGPLSQLKMTVPMFTVVTNKGSHEVEIPGQEQITEPGRPAVPFCAATVRFPKGCVVQNVALQQRDGLVAFRGLNLRPVVPRIGAGPGVPGPTPPGGWWPDSDFDWSVSENTDGSTDVTIRALAFFHNSDTTESRFYSNYVFGIAYATSPLEIQRWATDKRVYAPGETVRADLLVEQTNRQPVHVTAYASILNNDAGVGVPLPARPMPELKARGWCQFQWNTANQRAGDYALQVEVRDGQGTLLDTARAEFEVGGAAGRISAFALNPREFQPGQDVALSATFDNTGSTALDGTVIFAVQDAAGQLVSELRRDFTHVTAGSSFDCEVLWPNASLVPRNCQVVVYAQFAGQTTALLMGADWRDAPLRWDAASAAEGMVTLRWPSVAGRSYAIEFTPDLNTPFTLIAEGLPATAPRNHYVHLPTSPTGFYRLREQ